MSLKGLVKKWLGVSTLAAEIDHLRAEQEHERNRLTKRISELDKLTAIDADVGFRGPCTVVLTGVYRGRGYVKFLDMPIDEFEHFVQRCRALERRSLMRNVDVPPQWQAAFDLAQPVRW